jgi:prepilin-type N-terminal cleavage/methylation domain-containing protein
MLEKKNKQSGFTLIETVVAVAIFSIFLLFATLSMVNIMRTNERTNVLRKTENDTRYILESIMRDARYSNGVFSVINGYQERIKSVYAINGASVDVYNTDFENKEYTKTTYIYDVVSKTLNKTKETYNIGETNPKLTEDPVALNDPDQDLRITEFIATISPVDSPDLSIPPTLEIAVKAESAKGFITGKEEYIAKVELKSKVSPRNY